MPKFFVRAEAVNFDWSCYDTQDLNTIRGGSMLLMNTHELIRDKVNATLVVHGASQAIWSIEAESAEGAEIERRAIERALIGHDQLRHATFVVDVVPASADENVSRDLKALRTYNRWRQFQQPTLAVPEPYEGPHTGKTSYCEMDFVRPGTSRATKGDQTYSVSESVKTRREYGKLQKNEFYGSRLPANHQGRLYFANDLDDITSRANCGEKDPLKHLEHKMAVIYLDGNKQGEMAGELGLTDLQRFRDYTRTRQEEFLKSVFAEIVATQPSERESNDWYLWKEHAHLVRFETILWGGDDILLVVPAWKSWEIVRSFFNHVTGNSGEGWEFDGAEFTYSAGLVLCSHKASIHRMRDLAEELFVQGKKQANKEDYKNLLGYEVLESFDIASGDLEKWRAARLSSDPDEQELLLLAPDKLGPVADMVKAVQDEVEKPDSKVSRRKIERLAREMRRRKRSDTDYNGLIDNELSMPAFRDLQLTERQKLHHLVTLWDYIV